MYKRTFAVLGLSSVVIATSLTPPAFAGSKSQKLKPSISPEQYSNFRYHTQINSDFSQSDRFDLENPIEVEVTVHRVHLNEDGYVELFFSYPEDGRYKLPEGMDPDTPVATFRRATLQTADEFKRLKISDKDFEKGVAAVISGWPALPIQMPFSELLVDEIQLGRSGKKYVFHKESDAMVKYKDRDKPRKKDGDSDESTSKEPSTPSGS